MIKKKWLKIMKNIQKINIAKTEKSDFSLLEIINDPTVKFGWVISGLIQSDGSFGIKINKVNYGIGLSVNAFLIIELSKKSLPLLKSVHNYFGCGTLNIREDRNMCKFEITDINSLFHIVIPHFLNYPLFGEKYKSFVKFAQALTLLYPYHKKNKPQILLSKVIYLSAIINPETKRDLSKLEGYYKLLNVNKEDIIKPSISELNFENLMSKQKARHLSIL